MTSTSSPPNPPLSAPERSKLDRSFVKGVAWTGAAKWSIQLFTWAMTLVVARLLTPDDCEPDLVMASAGDIPTKEALAATVLLRENFPQLKIRFINVIDLYKLVPSSEHPHGLSDRDFDSLFTLDKPVIFNFHGYPWLIHRLAYRRNNHNNLHVRGYKEKGSINTPLELAIQNETDRFSLSIDAIDRIPSLKVSGAHVKEKLRDQQIDCRNYAYEHGIDRPEDDNWVWPY